MKELMTNTNETLPAVIDPNELAAFISDTRVSSEDLLGGVDFLPQLKVNYLDEIEYNNTKYDTTAKIGQLVVNYDDKPVFAKNAIFRPLLQTYQYINYDDDKKEVVCRSILFNDFSDEARDEQGTLRCGKPPSKVLKDNPELKKQYENINLYRSVDGLLTMEGEDIEGNKVSIENYVVTFRGKGVNFAPFNEEYIQVMPKGSILWDYNLKLGTTKHKNDPKSAASYYIVHFDADFAAKLPFTNKEFETAKELKRRIDTTNKDIDKAYYAALNRDKLNAELDEASDILDLSLDNE